MRTVIDIDDQALDRAAATLGTTTKKDTVNQALQAVAARASTAIIDAEVLLSLGIGEDLSDTRISGGGPAVNLEQFGPDRLVLIDSSALALVHDPRVHTIVAQLLRDGRAATCATIDLECADAARSVDSVRTVRASRTDRYRLLELDERAAKRARNVQQFLAGSGDKRRWAPIVSLLTAAVAELNDAVVLHHDQSFEWIATASGQLQAWVVAPGSTLPR